MPTVRNMSHIMALPCMYCIRYIRKKLGQMSRMNLLSTSQPRSAMRANTVPFVYFILQENSQALLTSPWQFVSLKRSASQNEEQSMGDSSVQSEDGMIPLLSCRISWRPHMHCLSVSSCGAPVFHWYLTTSRLSLAVRVCLSIPLTAHSLNECVRKNHPSYHLVQLAYNGVTHYTHPSAVSVILVTIPEHTIQHKLKIINAIVWVLVRFMRF